MTLPTTSDSPANHAGLSAEPQVFHFRTNVDHMLENNAISLYKDPGVPYREAVQNAADSIHAMLDVDPNHKGGINVEYTASDDGSACVCVTDNGKGMTPDEVHECYSTLGGTSKREGLHDPRARRTMGHFGIGNLSSFQLADEVVMFTRSALPGHPAMEWRGHRNGTYSLRTTTALKSHGTQLFLRLSAERAREWPVQRVIETLRRYAQFVPVQITFHGPGFKRVLTDATPPWRQAGGAKSPAIAHCLALTGVKAMTCFTARCEEFGFEAMVFVPEQAERASDDPQQWLFLKGMALTQSARELLPRYAPFLRIIANADGLRPNLARDALHEKEATLQAIRRAIGEAFQNFLGCLEREDPRLLREFVHTHAESLARHAAEDERFLRIVAPLLLVECTLGVVPLGELRGRKERIAFVTDADEYQVALPLARAHGVTLINGGYRHIDKILQRCARLFPTEKIEHTTADELRRELCNAVQINPALRQLLHSADEALRAFRCEVDAMHDATLSEPAMLSMPTSLTLDRAASRDADERATFMPWRDEEPELRATLHLNTAHPVVNRLGQEPRSDLTRAFVVLIYNLALRSASEVPLPSESRACVEAMLTLHDHASK